MRLSLPTCSPACKDKCEVAPVCPLFEAALVTALGIAYVFGGAVMVVRGNFSESAIGCVMSMGVGVGLVLKHIKDVLANARSAKAQQEIKADVAENTAITRAVETKANGLTDRLVQQASDAALAKGQAQVVAAVAATAPAALSAVVERVNSGSNPG